MAIDVRCDRVSKRYRVQRKDDVPAGLAGRAARALWSPTVDFWALRDASFDISRGETIGIIGRNGAGKSTILKLLGGITDPTEGEITIVGRLAALIEVGSGFHPELTGRENVFLSGAILGMKRREIRARLDSISDFSGVAAFLDTPVKYYSSGMYVRLGFAIAAHLEAHVLLVDEVLAVGDAEFQGRCLQRIQELKRNGATMVLVSHDLGAIEQLADRAILVDRGRLIADGSATDVITRYQRLVNGSDAVPSDADVNQPGDAPVRIAALTLHSPEGTSLLAAVAGAPLIARVSLIGDAATAARVTLSLYDFNAGTLLTTCSGEVPAATTPGATELSVEFTFPQLLLAPGVYTLGATVTPVGAGRPVAWRFGRTTLYVQGRHTSQGVFAQPFEYRVSSHSTAARLPVTTESS
jgi:ABC-type polysaccharide/polyol phosphate transport system ATPase subunit